MPNTQSYGSLATPTASTQTYGTVNWTATSSSGTRGYTEGSVPYATGTTPYQTTADRIAETQARYLVTPALPTVLPGRDAAREAESRARRLVSRALPVTPSARRRRSSSGNLHTDVRSAVSSVVRPGLIAAATGSRPDADALRRFFSQPNARAVINSIVAAGQGSGGGTTLPGPGEGGGGGAALPPPAVGTRRKWLWGAGVLVVVLVGGVIVGRAL